MQSGYTWQLLQGRQGARAWFMPAMTLVKPALRSTLTQVSLDARLSSK